MKDRNSSPFVELSWADMLICDEVIRQSSMKCASRCDQKELLWECSITITYFEHLGEFYPQLFEDWYRLDFLNKKINTFVTPELKVES